MKALIVSNLTRKFQAGHFSMIDPLKNLGYEVHWAANFNEFHGDAEKPPCKLHQIDFERNPINPKNIKAYKQLSDLVEKEKFDVLHCQSPIGGVVGRIVGHNKSIKNVIYTAHGLHFFKGAPLINQVVFKGVEKYLAKWTDAIIVMNKEDHDAIQNFELKNSKKNHYKIHGIGVDIKKEILSQSDLISLKYDLGLKDSVPVIISMGDLIKRKDYHTSIMAIDLVVNLYKKNVYYLICGEGPEIEKLRRLVDEKKLKKNVFFLGFRTDVSKLLHISNFFLFTSRQEGLPRSLMEAMNADLGCIVSNIRGNCDLIEDKKSGYLFDSGDYKTAARLINNLIETPNKVEAFAKNNAETLKKFSVENVKEEMLAIYSEVLRK